jgi:tetratricopeptide (TPR) repeat protein
MNWQYIKNRGGQIIVIISILIAVRTAALAYQRKPGTAPEGPVPPALMGAPLAEPVRTNIEKLLRAREYARAERLLLVAINQHPKSPRLLRLLGEVFFLDGKYLNCAVAMKKADSLAPIDRQSRFVLAMAYIAMKHPDWARPELEKLQRASPHNALYPYWLSRLDYHDMRLDEAVLEVRKAIQLNPRFMKAYDNLGLYEEGLGRNDEAIKAYREAMLLNQAQGLRSPWPALNLGTLLGKLGRFREAEACLRESLREAPDFPKAHFQLGLLLEKEHRDAEAIQELRRSLAYDPSYAEPYYILGRIYEGEHAPQKARAMFQAFQRLKGKEQHLDLTE